MKSAFKVVEEKDRMDLDSSGEGSPQRYTSKLEHFVKLSKRRRLGACLFGSVKLLPSNAGVISLGEHECHRKGPEPG